jgi:hypothetical protein
MDAPWPALGAVNNGIYLCVCNVLVMQLGEVTGLLA